MDRVSQFADQGTAQAALVQHGGRIAGPEPAPAALSSGSRLPPAVVEVDRIAGRNGDAGLGGEWVKLGSHLAGQQVT